MRKRRRGSGSGPVVGVSDPLTSRALLSFTALATRRANESLPREGRPSKVACAAALLSCTPGVWAGLCLLRDLPLDPAAFSVQACGRCYNYSLPHAFRGRRWPLLALPGDPGTLVLQRGNLTEVVESRDQLRRLVWDSFREEQLASRWLSCCDEADRCCALMANSSGQPAPDQCPMSWDGWTCWPEAPAPSEQHLPCPPQTTVSSQLPHCPQLSRRECLADGSWRLPTDYSPCSRLPGVVRRLWVTVAAQAVSAACLAPAILLFSSYGQLQSHRVSLHKHFFSSLLLYSLFEIAFTLAVMLPSRYQDVWLCNVLLLTTKYWRCSNYLWMFCEGFYLHRLLAAAFQPERSLVVFYVIGWGVPLLPVSVYALLRHLLAQGEPASCWVEPHHMVEWVLYVPSLVSLLVNSVFLAHIVCILVSKLRANHCREPSFFRKAVRGTLALLPLFGLNLLVSLYRMPNPSCTWELLYAYFGLLLDGLQGAFVAISFCFLNREVHSAVRRSYNLLSDKYRGGGARSHSRSSESCGAAHTTLASMDGF
ncbi:corticotropin-releasing factor receptor 1-like [Schistocerca serialis cubense]|uniref:corticotropin-releasing factor receptor 1-like n=1 Tax=Schistocerca serialis cubense TaxID=2023355 RepID=UPI00214F0A8E|nr:corticotropin-releasing factor receptor 1-like [Schistocerca serialis cubense]